MLSVQAGLRGSNKLRVGRKMATFQFFFSRFGLRTYQHPCSNCRIVSYGNRIDNLLSSCLLVVSCVYEGILRFTHEFWHVVWTSLVDALARKNDGVMTAKKVTCSDAAGFISAVSDGLERESEITNFNLWSRWHLKQVRCATSLVQSLKII